MRRFWVLLFLGTTVVSGAATSIKRQSSKEHAIHDDDISVNDNYTKNTSKVESLRQFAAYAPPGPRFGTENSVVVSSLRTRSHKAAFAPIRDNTHENNDDANETFDDCYKSHRMKDYSLAEQVEYLSSMQQQNGTETCSFQMLLEVEEERHRQQYAVTTATTTTTRAVVSPIFWGVLSSAGVLAVSSWIWDPLAAQGVWNKVISKKVQGIIAVAWLPFVWSHPTTFALVDFLILVQLVRLPAVVPYLKYQVVPLVYSTFKTMLVAEAWSRGWKWFFANLEQLRQAIWAEISVPTDSNGQLVVQNHQGGSTKNDANNDNNDNDNNNSPFIGFEVIQWPTNSSPPAWLVQTHTVIVGGIRKGIKSSFKKSVQETIMSSLAVWRNALTQQLKLFMPWEPLYKAFVDLAQTILTNSGGGRG